MIREARNDYQWASEIISTMMVQSTPLINIGKPRVERIDQNWSDVSAPIAASKELLGEDGIYYMYALGTMKESSAFRNLCRAYDITMDEYNEVGKNLDTFRTDKK